MQIFKLLIKNIVSLILSILVIIALFVGTYKGYELFISKKNPLETKQETSNKNITVNSIDYIIAEESVQNQNQSTEESTETRKKITKTGTILAGQQVLVTPEIAANIKTLNVSEGSLVKKGDLLATLENSSQLKNSIIAYNSANQLLENAYKLLNLSAESGNVNISTFQEQFAQAQLNVEKAALQLESSRAIRYSQFEVADINNATSDLQKKLTETQPIQNDLNSNQENITETRNSAEQDFYNQYLKQAIENNQNVSKVKSRELEMLQGRAQDDQNYLNIESAEVQLSLLAKQMKLSDLQNQASIVNAQNQIIQIKQQLESARISLSQGEIRSPINGVVANLNITAGSRVNPGENLLTVVNFDQIKVKLYVSPSEFTQLTNHSNLEILVNVLGEDYSARISYFGVIADPQSRTIPVEVIPVITDRKSKTKFIPNSFAKVQFGNKANTIAKNLNTTPINEAGFAIPVTSIVKKGSEFNLMLVENETTKLVAISVLPKIQNGKIIVTNGINSGDKIVRNPHSIKEGTKVTQ